MKFTKVADSHCPACGKKNNRVSSPHGVGPIPGDMSICCGCRTVLVFNENLSVRLPTDSELEKIDTLALSRMQNMLTALIKIEREENNERNQSP